MSLSTLNTTPKCYKMSMYEKIPPLLPQRQKYPPEPKTESGE